MYRSAYAVMIVGFLHCHSCRKFLSVLVMLATLYLLCCISRLRSWFMRVCARLCCGAWLTNFVDCKILFSRLGWVYRTCLLDSLSDWKRDSTEAIREIRPGKLDDNDDGYDAVGGNSEAMISTKETPWPPFVINHSIWCYFSNAENNICSI